MHVSGRVAITAGWESKACVPITQEPRLGESRCHGNWARVAS